MHFEALFVFIEVMVPPVNYIFLVRYPPFNLCDCKIAGIYSFGGGSILRATSHLVAVGMLLALGFRWGCGMA